LNLSAVAPAGSERLHPAYVGQLVLGQTLQVLLAQATLAKQPAEDLQQPRIPIVVLAIEFTAFVGEDLFKGLDVFGRGGGRGPGLELGHELRHFRIQRRVEQAS
jgi:hypothetical protein